VVLFPPLLARFFATSNIPWVANVANETIRLFSDQTIYAVLYFIMVFAFTYFYTAIIFQPQKIAENLQRQGGFIPGIRPGKQTEEYLQHTMTRLVFIGAVFLGAIAVLPLLVRAFTGTQSLVVGGTSLLIVVSVAIETAKQVESQLTMHEYDRV
jgi:preprotein translocase subunit SecY